MSYFSRKVVYRTETAQSNGFSDSNGKFDYGVGITYRGRVTPSGPGPVAADNHSRKRSLISHWSPLALRSMWSAWRPER